MKKIKNKISYIFMAAVMMIFAATFLVACGDSSGGQTATPTPSVEKVVLTVVGGNISGTSQTTQTYDKNSTVKVEAAVPFGKLFGGWSDGEKVISNDNPYTFKITQNATLSAVFVEKGKVTLSVLGSGYITGADKNSMFAIYYVGTLVSVGFDVPEGSKFDGWEVDGSIVSMSNPYSFTIDKNITITSTSSIVPIEVAPIMYNLEIIGGKYKGLTTCKVEEGEEVTVVADPDTELAAFKEWQIDRETVSGDKVYTFTMTKDMVVEALFGSFFKLTIFNDDAEPVVTKHESGTNVTLNTEKLKDGKAFVGWLNQSNKLVSENERFQFEIKYDIQLTAFYKAMTDQKNKYVLSLVGCTLYTDASYTTVISEDKNNIVDGGKNYYVKAFDKIGWDFVGIIAYRSNKIEYPNIETRTKSDAKDNFITWTLPISSYTGDTVVIALYTHKYTVSVTGGTISKSGSTVQVATGQFDEYEEITVTANTQNREFKHWIVNGKVVSQSDSTEIFMVKGDMQIEAIYHNTFNVNVTNGTIEGIVGSTADVRENSFITVKANPDTVKQKFVGWMIDGKLISNDSTKRELKFRVESDTQVEAVFDTYYTVTIKDGTVSGGKGGQFLKNSRVVLLASEKSDFVFSNWLINGEALENSTSSQIIIISSEMTISAVFKKLFTASVSDSFTTINGTSSITVIEGTTVTITANMREGFYFLGWSVGGANVDFDGTNFYYSFVLNSNVAISTRYIEKCVLTVFGAEGTGTFKKGDSVTLTAKDVPTKTRFKEWIDAKGVSLSKNATYTFKIEKTMTVTAKFVDLYEIETNGGKFSNDEYSGKRIGYFENGETINISADSIESGFRFVKWVNSKNVSVSTAKTFSHTVDGAENFSLVKIREYSVTVKGQTTQTFDENTTATVTATVPDGYIFEKWLDGDGILVSEINPWSFSVTKDMSLEAKFKQIRTVIVENEDGYGTKLTTKQYEVGEDDTLPTHTISLGELPNTKMKFLGWKRDGQIVSTENNYTVNVVEQKITVEATFSMMYTQSPVLGISTSKTNCSNYTDYSKGGGHSFIIPGLKQGENFVVQGIDYSEDLKFAFVCGYISPANGYSTNAVIFVLDMEQTLHDGAFSYKGKLVKEIILRNKNGTAYTGHAGGIAVTKNNIFISNANKLLRLSLDKVKASKQTAYLNIEEEIKVPVRASYCTFADDILWVGEFGIDTEDSKYIVDSTHLTDGFTAWTVGYELNEKGADGFDNVTGFKSSALATQGESATPDYILRHGDKIQGMTVAGNKIVLSSSYGRTNDSYIYIHDNRVYGDKKLAHNGTTLLNGVNVPYWDLKTAAKTVKAPPMTEDIAVYIDTATSSSGTRDYYILVATESASWLYNGAETTKSKYPMDVVWKFKIDQ